ncbi:MAG TPA: hypothetical protein VI248_17355 [Kineosporiaceae bacterium]
MSGGSAVPETLRFPDALVAADLTTFLERARRVDPGGAARLVGHGDVLAVYVSPVHGGGGPVVLGLRTLQLGAPSAVDATTPLAALLAELARGAEPARGPAAVVVPLERAGEATWAGTSPPRRGWQPVGAVEPQVIQERAQVGISDVAAGAPAGSGAAAVTALRARVWGRPLTQALPEVPAGVAFAVVALGYLDAAAPAAVYRAGPWWRVTTSGGHVLARRPLLP